jgi:hypothetical protein
MYVRMHVRTYVRTYVRTIKRNLHSCIENKPINKNQSTRNTVLSTLIHPTNVAIFDQDVVVILTKTKSLLLRRRP